MKNVRVLYLDDDHWIRYLGATPVISVESLERGLTKEDLTIGRGVMMRIIRESSIVRDQTYKNAPAPLRTAISVMTRNNHADVVIVGNNLGKGITRAQEIAEAMRSKTVIVWNDYTLGREKPYAELGFQHFCSRADLRQTLKKLIGIEEK